MNEIISYIITILLYIIILSSIIITSNYYAKKRDLKKHEDLANEGKETRQSRYIVNNQFYKTKEAALDYAKHILIKSQWETNEIRIEDTKYNRVYKLTLDPTKGFRINRIFNERSK